MFYIYNPYCVYFFFLFIFIKLYERYDCTKYYINGHMALVSITIQRLTQYNMHIIINLKKEKNLRNVKTLSTTHQQTQW